MPSRAKGGACGYSAVPSEDRTLTLARRGARSRRPSTDFLPEGGADASLDDRTPERHCRASARRAARPCMHYRAQTDRPVPGGVAACLLEAAATSAYDESEERRSHHAEEQPQRENGHEHHTEEQQQSSHCTHEPHTPGIGRTVVSHEPKLMHYPSPN